MSESSSEHAPPSRSSCPTCKAVFRGDFRRCPSDGALLVPGDEDPLVGSVLAERYQIEDVIGDGGLGRVYRARHVRMSRRFAIKVPFGEVGYDRKARARLANEADAASRLDHPNVIGVVDVGETPEGLFYLAMDLADGPSLGELLSEQLVTPADVLPILVQLADGLTHAHERGLVHRDLKPDNIVITVGADGGPVPRVIDFGLALVDDADAKDRLTTAGLVMGTPHYMAPEQATGEPLDFRTDLFALGIIAFELLAGRMPFDGSPTEVARQNVGVLMPTILERSGRNVDPLLEVLVMWLTRKSKLKRPAQTRDVLTYLRRLQAGDRDGARELLPDALRSSAPRQPTEPTVAAPTTASATRAAIPAPPINATATSPMAAVASGPAAESIAAVDAVPRAIPAPLRDPALDDDLPPPARRWPWLVALAAALAALIALIAWPRGGERAAAVATVPLDAGAAIDAAAQVALEPIDAAEPTPPPVDAAARVGTPAVVRAAPVDAAPAVARPPVDAAPAVVRAPPIDAGVAEPPPDVEGLSLKALYGRVARQLDDAVARLGTDRTAALRQRFAAVPPYLDAVRKPTLRADAEAQLKALARELAALK